MANTGSLKHSLASSLLERKCNCKNGMLQGRDMQRSRKRGKPVLQKHPALRFTILFCECLLLEAAFIGQASSNVLQQAKHRPTSCSKLFSCMLCT